MLRDYMSKLMDGVLNQRDRFVQLIETIPAYVSWISSDDKYLGVNNRLAAAYQLSPKEFMGKHIGFIEANSPFVRAVEKIRNSPDSKLSAEIQININGENRWHLLIAERHSVNGELLIIGIDITARKQVEDALSRSESRFRKLIENAPDSIGILIDQKIVYANPRLCDLLGAQSTETLAGTPLVTFLAPAEHEIFLKHLTTPSEICEYHFRSQRNEVLVPVEIAMIPTELDAQNTIIIFCRDLTHRREMAELKEAKLAAEEALSLKRKFIANISHEIRTPMNGVLGLTDLLLKSTLTQEQRDYLQAIHESATTLLVVINDVLDFEKLQAGKVQIEETPFKLASLLDTIIELNLPKATEKRVRVEKIIDPKLTDYHLGDPVRLNQIITNLVSNAIKFTDNGYIRIEAHVREITEAGQNLEFRIIDTGIGIPEDKLSVIFEEFTQASVSTTRMFGGTGLGLSIVRELTALMGGSIDVISRVGAGSTFTLRLNFKKAPVGHAHSVQALSAADTSSNPNLSILLAEDNPINQLVARKVLEGFGFNVDVAENGVIAVEKLKNHPYDLVIMDVQMPQMDGLTATRAIRSTLPPPASRTPIIAMTAFASKQESDACLEAGMDDFMSKPFIPKTLLTKILKLSPQARATETEQKNHEPSAPKLNTHPPEGLRLVNLTYLKDAMGDDQEVIKQMLEIFLTRAPILIENLEKGVSSEDWVVIKTSAHDIKSSFAYLGVQGVSDQAREIEQIAKQLSEPISSVKTKVEKFLPDAKTAIEEVKKLLKDGIKNSGAAA